MKDRNLDKEGLEMESLKLAFTGRAEIYQWFSSLFALELTQEQMEAYQKGGIENLLRFLTHYGLQKESERLQNAINTWQLLETPRLELAADFASLFLLDGKHGALPYASHYLEADGNLYGDAERLMREYLAESELKLHKNFREPADHLAVFLALLARWNRQTIEKQEVKSVAKEQQNFIADTLLSWVPTFAKRVSEISVASDFYPAVVALLLSFLHLEEQFLQSLLLDD